MGTRAQVYMKDEGVYLYQHYDGNCLMETVTKAVQSDVGKGRQNDSEYLARIIFSAMVKNDIDGETGYGIGTTKHGDIEYLVTVDCEKKTITELNVYSKQRRTISF
jgi:hypothetical protein